MSLLVELGQGAEFLKAGLLGFPKSGKTYTAVEIAIGLYKYFGLKGDIVFYDTENGVEYVAERIRKAIGKYPKGLKSRSFTKLMAVTEEVRPHEDILLVDSITHPWRELCAGHLKLVNDRRAKQHKDPRSRLEFQDWGPIKETWQKWNDWFLNSPCHVIMCGRAGYEYDYQTDDDNNRELVKTDVKMKTEGELGYEPSLLIEMQRVNDPDTQRATKRQALVRGDRFAVLDGKIFENPVFRNFLPHIKRLKPGAHIPVDTDIETETGIGDGDGEWSAERKQRAIIAEEIQGLFLEHLPGQTTKDKQERQRLLVQIFNTRSWTVVAERTSSQVMREGLRKLTAHFEAHPQQRPSDELLSTETAGAAA
jgi:AAA domain